MEIKLFMNIEQVREKFKGAIVYRYEKAQKNLDGKYMSHRNNEDIPLVCQELNVLTVEDYDKWYGLYYLMEDPDTKEVMLVTLCHGDILEGIDHEYYPDSVIRFCVVNNIAVDAVSLVCISTSLLFYREDLFLEHRENKNKQDLFKVQIRRIKESISYTFYKNGMYRPLY